MDESFKSGSNEPNLKTKGIVISVNIFLTEMFLSVRKASEIFLHSFMIRIEIISRPPMVFYS